MYVDTSYRNRKDLIKVKGKWRSVLFCNEILAHRKFKRSNDEFPSLIALMVRDFILHRKWGIAHFFLAYLGLHRISWNINTEISKFITKGLWLPVASKKICVMGDHHSFLHGWRPAALLPFKMFWNTSHLHQLTLILCLYKKYHSHVGNIHWPKQQRIWKYHTQCVSDLC